ncbi:MAG: ComF family protein [Fimbriimonadaceae bacterium]|nr:ComF family protein [Fimbriimonadaceae bacterium]
MGQRWVEGLLDWVFPRRCGLCSRLGDEAVCALCRAEFLEGPTDFDLARLGGAVDRLVTPFAFAGRASQAVRRLKYDRVTSLSGPMATMVAEAFEAYGLAACDLVVPVPISRRRRFERGFNQSELLAGGLPPERVVPAALARIRHTRPQVGLSAPERLRNLVGAFVAEPGYVRGKSVVLLDDVVTTGGTAVACGQELKRCGAREVVMLAFCGGRPEDGA